MCYNSKKKGTLMTVTIPDFPLPFEIPHLMHPFIVHFAIALPIIWLILELINLIAKRRLLSGITLFFALLTVLIFFGAYLTGKTDAKEAQITLEALDFHKELGVYLVYGSVVVLFLKLLSFAIQKTQMRVIFILSLLIFIAVTLVEGKKGGELVYQYGVNVQTSSKPHKAALSTPTKEEKVESKHIQETKPEEPKTTTENKTQEQTQKETPASIHQEEKSAPQTEHNTTTKPTIKPVSSAENNHTTKAMQEHNTSAADTETNTTQTAENNHSH